MKKLYFFKKTNEKEFYIALERVLNNFLSRMFLFIAINSLFKSIVIEDIHLMLPTILVGGKIYHAVDINKNKTLIQLFPLPKTDVKHYNYYEFLELNSDTFLVKQFNQTTKGGKTYTERFPEIYTDNKNFMYNRVGKSWIVSKKYVFGWLEENDLTLLEPPENELFDYNNPVNARIYIQETNDLTNEEKKLIKYGKINNQIIYQPEADRLLYSPYDYNISVDDSKELIEKSAIMHESIASMKGLKDTQKEAHLEKAKLIRNAQPSLNARCDNSEKIKISDNSFLSAGKKILTKIKEAALVEPGRNVILIQQCAIANCTRGGIDTRHSKFIDPRRVGNISNQHFAKTEFREKTEISDILPKEYERVMNFMEKLD